MIHIHHVKMADHFPDESLNVFRTAWRQAMRLVRFSRRPIRNNFHKKRVDNDNRLWAVDGTHTVIRDVNAKLPNNEGFVTSDNKNRTCPRPTKARFMYLLTTVASKLGVKVPSDELNFRQAITLLRWCSVSACQWERIDRGHVSLTVSHPKYTVVRNLSDA